MTGLLIAFVVVTALVFYRLYMYAGWAPRPEPEPVELSEFQQILAAFRRDAEKIAVTIGEQLLPALKTLGEALGEAGRRLRLDAS